MLDILKKVSHNKIFMCLAILIIIMFPHTIYMQSDNNTKLVVTTIGIDIEDDKYKISSLAVIPKVSTDVNANLEVFEGEGKTISEALQSISLNTGKEIGLAHCDCIILSKEILTDNITLVLDYFIRTSNLSTNATILCTNDKAKDLVEVSKNSNNLLDLSLKDIVTYQENTTLLENTTIERFYRTYFSTSGTFFLPVVDVEKDSGSDSSSGGESSGSGDSGSSSTSSNSGQSSSGKIKNDHEVAIIKDGKFLRTLTDDERFIYNLLSKTSGYLNIEIEDVNDIHTNNSLEIFQQVSKIGFPMYKFENGKPTVTYEIWLNIMLEEIQSRNNFAITSIDALKNFLSDVAEQKILDSIQTKLENSVAIMKESKSDVLHLYSKFNAYKHKDWAQYMKKFDNQEDYLNDIDIKINVHLSYVI